MLFASITGIPPKWPYFNGIFTAFLYLLVSSLIPGILNAPGGTSSTNSGPSVEQDDFIKEIEQFAQELAVGNKEFDQENRVIKEMLAKRVPDGKPSLKQCLLDPELLKLDSDGTIGQIVDITEAYFKEFNLNMDPEYQNGQTELVLLKKVTALFMKFHLSSEHVKFLEGKIDIGIMRKAEETKIELIKRLHKFRVDTNKKIDAFLKRLWFQMHSKFITDLFKEVKADQEPFRKEIRRHFDTNIFKEIPKIIKEEVKRVKPGFERIFQDIGKLYSDGEQSPGKKGSSHGAMNVEKSPRKRKEDAASSSPTFTNDSSAVKNILKEITEDLQMLHKEHRYSAKFTANLYECTKLINIKTLPMNEAERTLLNHLKVVYVFAIGIVESIKNKIDHILKKEMNKNQENLAELSRKIMLNSMTEQMFYLLGPEIGINFEHNEAHSNKHYDEPFQRFALLNLVVGQSVKPNLLKIIVPVEKKTGLISRLNFSSKKVVRDVFTSVRECLAHSKETDKSPSDLYSLVMELEQNCVLERVVNKNIGISKDDCSIDVSVQIALNAFKTLALFRRLGTLYNEMGQMDLIKEYEKEKSKEKNLSLILAQMRNAVKEGCSQKIKNWIFDEFPKKEEKILDKKGADEDKAQDQILDHRQVD